LSIGTDVTVELSLTHDTTRIVGFNVTVEMRREKYVGCDTTSEIGFGAGIIRTMW